MRNFKAFALAAFATIASFAAVSADAANLNLGSGKISAAGVQIVGADKNALMTCDLNPASSSVSVMSTVSELTADTLMVGGHEYITADGIDANHQRITGVRAGKANTDAVNVRQLKAVDARVTENSQKIADLGNTVSSLDSRVDNVGSNLAAMAALHPTDDSSRLSVAAGVGNYAGTNAVALGVFYRPNENVMLSLGGSFGSSENMVNAGVSVRVGASSKKSRAVLEAENKELESKVDDLESRVTELERLLHIMITINNER